MTEACSCDLESGFDDAVAAQDLAAYRRHGLPADQRRLLAAITAHGISDRTVLDIGGGIGAIHHELLGAGARSLTDVDGSTAYLKVAAEEARRRGDQDRISYRHGDFVQLAEDIDPADIVVLLRVLCCYPDMPSLVRASARRARRSYGLIYPRSTWWMRAAAAAYTALRPIVGPNTGPGHVHAERDVDAAVRREGFRMVAQDATWLWRVALYERIPGAADQGR